MPYRIHPLGEADLPEYFLHSLKTAAESGVDGTPVFTPFDERTPLKPAEAKEYARAFRLDPATPGWRRTFGLFHQGRIVGDLDFYGSSMHSGLHRVMIGMAIQREHVGKGQGERLLRHGIDWAKSHPIIEYLDLHVFESNAPAVGLYKKCGFTAIGARADAFRVRGQCVTDLVMTLKIR